MSEEVEFTEDELAEDLVGPPRWVKVFGAIALVAIALFVVVTIAGGGDHGPGRHLPSIDRHEAPSEGHRP